MNWLVFYILIAASGLMLIAERFGLPLTLALNFKGDVKRETRWLAQYGQALCSIVAALLIWQLDTSPDRQRRAWLIIAAVFITSIIAMLVKRILGRVRPGRERAGQFLGPTWKHANYRESFPSSHSASAVALSASLIVLYPRAAIIFWALAIGCALLRYIMDAHWPSDVLAGVAMGYGMAHLVGWCMGFA